ncbi:hypothetical protein [Nitrobacter sp.]|uniref:hypothetical protein n=1 Tax=Nitrobacter sp. TaxID=29420 RepID=UPI001D25A429|nr:hypothetical protein [Nitrobacter sp.]MCB1393429.1 hypothetical protein [Nitrobacter sp.]MCV0385962.1 hypothetical protein [Nitrobacter sp.]
MPRTPVYIICSPRPQVGKTLIARQLSEFLRLQRGDVLAFDVNLKEPSLVDYLPRLTETAAIDDTFGKMALMDQLIVNDGLAKVVDLGYPSFDEFFAMIDEIGFVKEAARSEVAPVVLFTADSDRVSARGYQTLRATLPPNAIVTIDNEFVLHGKLPEAFMPNRVMRIAALPAFIKTYIDRLTFSFTEYLRTETDSSTELHQWIRHNYFGFREIERQLM